MERERVAKQAEVKMSSLRLMGFPGEAVLVFNGDEYGHEYDIGVGCFPNDRHLVFGSCSQKR